VVELVRLESVLDEPIGRGGPALGERVAYAAALLGDPEVMLLDQPLSSVDLTERSRLLRLRGAGKSRIKTADGHTVRMRVGFTPVLDHSAAPHTDSPGRRGEAQGSPGGQGRTPGSPAPGPRE
jgi:hypothetical protein